MNEYTDRFIDRRSGRDRRDWNEFILHDRRIRSDRRDGQERRKQQFPFSGPEKRQLKASQDSFSPQRGNSRIIKLYYNLHEVAKITNVSPSDILEWIRSQWIHEEDIKFDDSGLRLFTKHIIPKIMAIKNYVGNPR